MLSRAVIDEETGVLRVREVVLEERGVAADLRQMDVHEPRVGGEFVGVEVGVHEQAGAYGHRGGSVAHRRTIYRINVRKGRSFDWFDIACAMESTLKSGNTSAFQQVVRIVERPPTDRLGNGSIIGRRGEGG